MAYLSSCKYSVCANSGALPQFRHCLCCIEQSPVFLQRLFSRCHGVKQSIAACVFGLLQAQLLLRFWNSCESFRANWNEQAPVKANHPASFVLIILRHTDIAALGYFSSCRRSTHFPCLEIFWQSLQRFCKIGYVYQDRIHPSQLAFKFPAARCWFQCIFSMSSLGMQSLDGNICSPQLVFNRFCSWFGSALCSSLSIEFVIDLFFSYMQLIFIRICHWFGPALCSLLFIEFVIGMDQL